MAESSGSDAEDDLPLTALFGSLSVDAASRSELNVGSTQLEPETSSVPCIALRDYQRALLDDANGLFEQGNRAVLAYLPTGGGKTRVGAAAMAEVLQTSATGTCLFVVNRKSLMEQTRASLLAVGFEADSIELIGGGKQGDTECASVRVQVAMVQSLHERCLSVRTFSACALAIIDECHAAAAPSYLRLLDALPRSARVLGLTATPFRSTPGESLAAVFPAAAWGPSVTNLIRRSLLAPPVVFAPKAPAGEVRVSARARGGGGGGGGGGGLAPLAGSDQTVRLEAALSRAVKGWHQHAEGERTVAFCPSIAASVALAGAFVARGVAAAHVDGETADRERVRLFADLRSGALQVLCNVDVLSEGFDEPSVSCVLLLRHTDSPRVYVQQVGRGLRPHPGKERCIVLDEVGATWRHGPLTGPVRSDYRWEDMSGGSEAARKAVLRRCSCGALSHRLLRRCPGCGSERVPSDADVRACAGGGREARSLEEAMASMALQATPCARAPAKPAAKPSSLPPAAQAIAPKLGPGPAAPDVPLKNAVSAGAEATATAAEVAKKPAPPPSAPRQPPAAKKAVMTPATAAEVEAKAEVEAEAKAEVEAKAEAEVEATAKAEVEAKAKAEVEAKAEVDADAGSEVPPGTTPVPCTIEPRAKPVSGRSKAIEPEAKKGHMPRQRPCRFFAQGRCRNGDACGYLHQATATKPLAVVDVAPAQPTDGARPPARKSDVPVEASAVVANPASERDLSRTDEAAAAGRSAAADPAENAPAEENAPPNDCKPPRPSATGLPPHWVVEWSKGRGRWYFFHVKLKHAQWHRPAAADACQLARDAELSLRAWGATLD